MNGEVIVVDDVAAEFAERVVEAFHGRPDDGFSLVLSGGPTARRCYERLAADAGDQIDWWQVDVYWGDERCVPPEDPDSNERLGREALLERVGAANAVYPMRCDEGPDPYQQRIAHAGRLDLVHLGLGPDGHTASLVPNDPVLEVTDRRVAMTAEPYQDHLRMTLTYPALNDARRIVWLVTGPDKRDPLQKLLAGDDSIPAGRVQNENMLVVADEAAAS